MFLSAGTLARHGVSALLLTLLSTIAATAGAEALAPAADIAVTKTDSPDPVPAGSILTYLIAVTNSGAADAFTVNLTDVIPAGTSAVSWQQLSGPAVTTGGGAGNFFANWTTFPAGATAAIQFNVFVPSNTASGTVISNTATATTASAESSTANNSATATTTVNTSADMIVSKFAGPGPVPAGGDLTYTITVSNNGPSDGQSIILSDTVPVGTTFVSFTAPAGWATTTPPVGGTGTVTSTISSFAGGSPAAVFTLVVHVPPATPPGSLISNTAIVSSATADPNPSNNNSTVVSSVTAASGTVPALSPLMLALLAAALLGFALLKLKA